MIDLGSLPLPAARRVTRPVLMLSTIHAQHAKHSGYNRLAEYVAEAEFLHATRSDPRGAGLFFARVARRFAFSRWYLGGSAALEWKAFQKLWAGFEGVVHSMWADHDLGYLDLILKRHHRLCGTFHNCPDDFQHTVRFPRRLHRFDAVILMSECQRPFFSGFGVSDNKIHVVLHGVDTDYFTLPAQKKDEGFKVLSVGSFRRNFPLLRAVCELLVPRRDLCFHIVAQERYRPMFAHLPNVRFFVGLSDEALLDFYQSASCLLHTAEQATANNGLLEGMACGLPIVAESVGGIPEYVHEDCGVLTEPKNSLALAEAITALAESASMRADMGGAARNRAEDLSWSKVASRTEAIYREL